MSVARAGGLSAGGCATLDKREDPQPPPHLAQVLDTGFTGNVECAAVDVVVLQGHRQQVECVLQQRHRDDVAAHVLEKADRGPRAGHPDRLADRADGVGDAAEAEGEDDGIEAAVGESQRAGVHLEQLRGGPRLKPARAAQREHPGAQVDADHVDPRPVVGESRARPDSDLQYLATKIPDHACSPLAKAPFGQAHGAVVMRGVPVELPALRATVREESVRAPVEHVVTEGRGIQIVVEASEISSRVNADAERVFQLMSNLLGNAIKFAPVNGNIWIRLEPGHREVEFRVRDDGPGIPPEQLPRLFDRYWQARETKNGTGLGLYIARGIVEAHGGRIWAESAMGEGTTMVFTLPSER